jgi:hypothetical protein
LPKPELQAPQLEVAEIEASKSAVPKLDAAIPEDPKPEEPKPPADGLYFDPQSPTPVVPLWLLATMPVTGEVSLTACDAMLVEDAGALGPVGIGPTLRACGALSVIGPIWPSDQLVSALFYPVYHAARKDHSALQALAQAQDRIRRMSLNEIVQRLPQDCEAAVRHYLGQLSDDPAQPLAHPALWSNFTVLGDAPPMPAIERKKVHQAPGNEDPAAAGRRGLGEVLASSFGSIRRFWAGRG